MICGPDFLGIGAPRCGTTWLHDRMLAHPDIWVPPIKELHFFDRDPRYPSPATFATANPWKRFIGFRPWRSDSGAFKLRGAVAALARGELSETRWWLNVVFGHYDEAFYASLFPRDGYGSRGEITPAYSILDDEDIARIHALNPEMKLIFMIRNPVDRIWSALRYNLGRGRVALNIDDTEAVLAQVRSAERPDSRLQRGDYRGTLDAYARRFDSSQILVVFYDAIAADPDGLLNAVARFLDVAPWPAGETQRRINASTVTAPMPEAIRRALCKQNQALCKDMAATFGSYAHGWSGDSIGPAPAPAIRYDKATVVS